MKNQKPKFKLDQEVYFIYNQDILKGRIANIRSDVEETYFDYIDGFYVDPNFSYDIQLCQIIYCDIEEREVFSLKEKKKVYKYWKDTHSDSIRTELNRLGDILHNVYKLRG